MLEITILGAEAISLAFEYLADTAKGEIVDKLAQELFDRAQAAADKHTKSGALFDSLQLRPIPDGWAIAHDLQRAPHAMFVHWGARPHDIRPAAKKSLRWVNGSEFMFSKFVHHPGYKGDPYLITVEAEAPEILDDIIKNLKV